MLKDDFHIIAYRILQYLYDCMKKGNNLDVNKIVAKNYDINDRYFNQIIRYLYNSHRKGGIFIIRPEQISKLFKLFIKSK